MAISQDKIKEMDAVVNGKRPPLAKQVATAMTKKQESKVPTVAKVALPVAGGAAGGWAGAGLGAAAGTAIAPGPGTIIGGILGGIGGAGIGGAGGQAGVNLLEHATGGKPPATAGENLQSLLQAAKDSATSQAIGGALGKFGGLFAHPIAPFTNRVKDILAKSTKNIDIDKILSQYRDEVLPEFAKKGVNASAREEYKKMVPDIVSATRSLVPHNSNEISDVVPISAADQLKKNIYRSVKDFYGGETQKMGVESRKQLGRLLKDAIESAEPGVKIPNKIASLLYKVPNAAEAMTYALPNYRSQALLRHLGSLPFKGIQKAIPEGGGYLNKLLPLLINLGNFPQEQN